MIEKMFIVKLKELRNFLNNMSLLVSKPQDIEVYNAILDKIESIDAAYRQHNTQLADMVNECDISHIKEVWIQYNNNALVMLKGYRESIDKLRNKRLKELANDKNDI